MSAVASATTAHAASASAGAAHGDRTEQQVADAEMYRWMRWFGFPVLVCAIFMGAVFATGEAWWIGLAIATLIGDIFVLVWLCMSSDTNGLLGDAPAHH